MTQEEVKRFAINHLPHKPPPLYEREDGELCLHSDYEAERLAHEVSKKKLKAHDEMFKDMYNANDKIQKHNRELEKRLEATELRLRELEDAITAYDSQHEEMSEIDGQVISNAIENSRERQEGKV
jgi:uncharacterized protein YPO0396